MLTIHYSDATKLSNIVSIIQTVAATWIADTKMFITQIVLLIKDLLFRSLLYRKNNLKLHDYESENLKPNRERKA